MTEELDSMTHGSHIAVFATGRTQAVINSTVGEKSVYIMLFNKLMLGEKKSRI